MNKIALVTGANRGIGLEACRQLARRGLRVILTSRDRQAGLAAQREQGVETLVWLAARVTAGARHERGSPAPLP